VKVFHVNSTAPAFTPPTQFYALQPLGLPDIRGMGCLGSGGGKATLTLTDNYFKEGEIDSLDRSRFKALIRRELKRLPQTRIPAVCALQYTC
jgi:hypothetical protein